MFREIDSLTIHVDPSKDSLSFDAIPADRLLEIVGGLRSIVNGLADALRPVRQDGRSRFSQDEATKKHYQLFLKPSVAGCYAIPVFLCDTRDSIDNQDSLFENTELNFESVIEVIEAAKNNDQETFHNFTRSKIAAQKVLDGIKRLAPKNDSVSFVYGKGSKESVVSITDEVCSFDLSSLLYDEIPVEKEVVAKISEINFDDHTMKVKPLKSPHKISCQYDDAMFVGCSLEDVESQTWKIFCSVTYNSSGSIKSITEIKSIDKLSLDDIEISSFEVDGRDLTFKSPLKITPRLDDETQSLFVATIDTLDIYSYSEILDDLRDVVKDQLSSQWEWIVEKDIDNLAPRAQLVRQAFIDMVER